MDLRRWLLLLARVCLPAVGFSMACLGALLISGRSNSSSSSTVKVIFAYVCIICGLLVLMVGVSWTICLGMKSKVYQQRRRRPAPGTVHVHTVDRPDFYPPSYEQSLDRNNVVAQDIVVTENELHHNIAPPLYTRRSSEALNDDFSCEEPPSYKEAILRDHGGPDTQTSSPDSDSTLVNVPLDSR